jgi:hypothetical protein
LAGEAAERQVKALQQMLGETDADFATRVLRVRGLCTLSVGIHGANGELVGGAGFQELPTDQLPLKVVRVLFDSGFLHLNQTGLAPLNTVVVTLDFRRARVLEGLLGVPEQVNESSVTINGGDTTWVNGTFTQLRSFFEERASHRDWLHSPRSYSVAALLGIPLSLYWVYRIDHWFAPSLLPIPEALKVAIYVYIVLLIMFIYRVTFNVVRKTFPKLEGPTRQAGHTWLQNTVPGLLVLALLSDLLIQAVKAIVAKLF